MKNGWVSDEIITAYLHMVVQLKNLIGKVCVIDLTKMTKICNGNFYYDRKKMITLALSQYDLVIGAYHQSGNHWTLLCIKPKESSVIYIDPKGESATFVDQLTKNWTYFAKAIMLNKTLPKSVKDLYRLRNEMAVELLNASEPLDDYCHACGMTEACKDSDDDWIKCDDCDWWYHLRCINKKLKGRNYLEEEAETLNFHGACCTTDAWTIQI